ncbi:MAG: acylphosphatase [Fidelibacterota bacterium]
MTDNICVAIRIEGRVQMVGFRWFVRQWADDLGLSGWVRNNPDGSVGVEVEGNKEKVETLVTYLKEGPKLARVEHVKVDSKPFENRFRSFEIRY